VSNGETGQNLARDGLLREDGGEKAAAAGRWVLEKSVVLDGDFSNRRGVEQGLCCLLPTGRMHPRPESNNIVLQELVTAC
jgi:hypothetical protein